MLPFPPPLTGLVLAGGQGCRLGKNKALLEWEGEPLVRLIARRLQTVCERVLVVTPFAEVAAAAGVPAVKDEPPDSGPLGGLWAGLQAAETEYCAVTACDLPFFNPELVAYLATLAAGYEAVVPYVNGSWQPLPALYARTCAKVAEELLAQRKLALRALLDQVRVRQVDEAELRRLDPELTSFRNLNTWEDYRRWTGGTTGG